MTDQLSLYNRALRHLKVRRLANLNEDVLARYELDAVYTEVKQAMLEKAGWKFALRTSQLTADADDSPSFGLNYAFTLPDDLVRWAAICLDDQLNVEDGSFDIKNGLLFSNSQILYVKYVNNGATYGFDLSKFPDNYCEAFACEMAERTALLITKDDAIYQKVQQDNVRLLARAKNFDAIQEAVRFKPAGTFTSSRRTTGAGPYFRNGNMRLGG